MDKITLDRETFKALASDTRLDILKALDVRQKTVTELAKELNLNKATVFEHLEKLAAVNLIQKLEDERKWVYWQLTWTGRRLLHPEKITLALALSSAGASLVTALVAAFLWMRSAAAPPPAEDAMIMRSTPIDAPPEPVQRDPVLMAVWIGAGAVTLALLLFSAWYWRNAKAKSGAAQPA